MGFGPPLRFFLKFIVENSCLLWCIVGLYRLVSTRTTSIIAQTLVYFFGMGNSCWLEVVSNGVLSDIWFNYNFFLLCQSSKVPLLLGARWYLPLEDLLMLDEWELLDQG